jgi:NAD(P)-dependent dehydrogenase (short-subunit alcohol dehydrogenase family)
MSTRQTPLGSGFSAASTAADVIAGIDLAGRRAVVTGGYSGLGLETARVLAGAGAEVVVPARDVARAGAAVAGIAGITVEPMDLLDPASIDGFAARHAGSPLHVLVNSAGIMATPLRRDLRGYESQLVTNHLGHAQLVAGLWPALAAARGARVVAVSSWGHRFADVDYDDPNFEHRPYEPFLAYGQSKTANILYALGLDRRGAADGVRAFSLHPGRILTNLGAADLPAETFRASGMIDEAGAPVVDPGRDIKSIPQGAATSVWCATSPLLADHGGVYCMDSDIAAVISADEAADLQFGTNSRPTGVLWYAVDDERAERLWTLTERLLDLKFL